MITPREMLRDYMTVLNIMMQNENVKFADIVGTAVTLKTDDADDSAEAYSSESAPKEEKKTFTIDDITF